MFSTYMMGSGMNTQIYNAYWKEEEEQNQPSKQKKRGRRHRSRKSRGGAKQTTLCEATQGQGTSDLSSESACANEDSSSSSADGSPPCPAATTESTSND